jgi:tRNA(Ile)-lysidine synthase
MRPEEIPPLEKKIIAAINESELIRPGQKVLAALSGGADSVFLTLFLNQFKKFLGIQLAACHVHHHLRGTESDEDAEFCRNFCLENDIHFIRKDIHPKEETAGRSLEDTSRELRYNSLKEAADECGADLIATAHQMDDLAETMIQRFFQGSGLPALAGIPIRRGNIIRPLLSVTRKEIEKSLESAGQSFRKDLSNADSRYLRNFIRNELAPVIEKRFPSYREKAAELSRIIREEDVVWKDWTAELEKYANRKGDGFQISFEVYSSGTALPVIRRFVREKILEMTDWEIVPSRVLLEKIEEFAAKKTGNAVLFESRNYRIILSYGKLLIGTQGKNFPYLSKYVKLNGNINLELEEAAIVFQTDAIFRKSGSEDGVYFCVIASGVEGLTVRHRKDGDRIAIAGGKRKKLQDILTDDKIPLPSRERTLVFEAPDGRIAAIFIPGKGFRVSREFYVSSDGTGVEISLVSFGR